MPEPRDVFDHPEKFWQLLTAADDGSCEDQYFDRKEAGRAGSDGSIASAQISGLRDHVIGTVSAFANVNRTGGLLALGISKTGLITGTRHLSDAQRNSITHIDALLVNQAAQVQMVDCINAEGNEDQVILIYAPLAQFGICETPGPNPRAWRRSGAQNVPLTADQREQIRRDKRLVDFELTPCSPYNADEVDRGLLDEFRRLVMIDARFEKSDEELLYHAGALTKQGSEYWFTNAGYLFFAANPQRLLQWAQIRLLRFEVSLREIEHRGLPTFDRFFSGPITKQIRDFRSFAQESGFFKVYQRRSESGVGFVEDPELPAVAVDEAIVNAVAHRDYAMHLHIEVAHYRDGLVVRNPGRVIQHDRDVPARFSLDQFLLDSAPRNPKLMEWLRSMRDERGAEFVRALNEGTRQMQESMQSLGLEPPSYRVSDAHTTVFLRSDAPRREVELQAEAEEADEFTNLFPLGEQALHSDEDQGGSVLDSGQREFLTELSDQLSVHGWYVDSIVYGRLEAHRQRAALETPGPLSTVVRFYPSYSFQLRRYWRRHYLCIDYGVAVKNVLSARDLLGVLKAEDLVRRAATVHWQRWMRGRLLSLDHEWCHVRLFDFEQDVRIPSDRVIPDLPPRLIESVLSHRHIDQDIQRIIKDAGLASQSAASRIRADRIRAAAENLSDTIFPLEVGGSQITLLPRPAPLIRGRGPSDQLRVRSLKEPAVEFSRGRESANIREGITSFGAYENRPRTLEIVPICIDGMRPAMATLIERLRLGKHRYRGSERTFSTRLSYGGIISVPRIEEIEQECEQLLANHPEWIGNSALDRIFLVHTPEAGYSSDNEQSPYYRVKKRLLESGLPCQMVDTPTLMNPDWKDLNLSLNIIAKCGAVPWVLSEAMPDADFFIGLSYTQHRDHVSNRYMGYANVFNQYGRWLFYSGNYQAFSYADRVSHLSQITQETMRKIQLPESPNIVFHYSSKYSTDDRNSILSAARAVRPLGTYTFVWVNTHHTVRFFDRRPEGDGSLRRGSYVMASPNQFYLSTTGYNQYRKILGSPRPLEVSVRTERPDGAPNAPPDLRTVAVQLLSLTKLNWASTDSLCAEPITTKYAGDIAYLTDAFLRQGSGFRLHPVLERTPWFL